MVEFVTEHFESNQNSVDPQLTPEFQEMRLRAEAAEAKLRRIYNSPIWQITKPIRKIYSRIDQTLAAKSAKTFEYISETQNGQSVRELVAGDVVIECNNADFSQDSFAVIAHWAPDSNISKSLEKYLTELKKNGFELILVSASPGKEQLKFGQDLENSITIIRKPNLGYDFGSWSIALEAFPQLINKSEILLTNDSLIGPLFSLDSLISKLRGSQFSITSITDNLQLQYHLQSYFLYFKDGSFANKNIQKFFADIAHHTTKNEIILKYELGLTRVAQLSGIFVGALFPWNLVVTPGKNPSMHGWERLLTLGFPFVKKEALRRLGSLENSKIKGVLKAEYPEAIFAIDEANNIKP